jgi:uncharacterized membrane protein HdeD (DUF308 family)
MSILYIVVGFMMISNPVGGAISLTLLLTAFFIVSGLFRIVASASLRYPQWGWGLFSGIVSICLGVLVFAQWPVSGIWLVGTLVGVDLVFAGWSVVMFAWSLHSTKQLASV